MSPPTSSQVPTSHNNNEVNLKTAPHDPHSTSSVLHRDINHPPPLVISAQGQYLHLSDGRRILDATCGAAVSCLGHDNPIVQSAMFEQINSVSYVHSLLYATPSQEELCAELIRGTNNQMAKAYIVSSGSEAMEAAMKLARQYYLEKENPEPERTLFISREGSYHGTTLGALSISGHKARRDKFLPILGERGGRVSDCNEYRGVKEGETIGEYVNRLAQEVEDMFQQLGPNKVIAFVAETVVGATLGCVPPLPDYFPLIQRICHKHGALLILDEVMSGMGRCGTLHAWEQLHLPLGPPDLQTIGKGLGGGYASVAGVLASPKIVNALARGSGQFVHGHTYQAHPVACAAALAVQREIREKDLLKNVRVMGEYLHSRLKEEFVECKYVGDVRGWGLFIGLEIVKDKKRRGDGENGLGAGGEPWERAKAVAYKIAERGLQPKWGISLFAAQGCADGWRGDHIILAPVYMVTKDEVDEIVRLTVGVVKEVMLEIDS